MWVESTLNHGSTFHFTIPAVPVESEKKAYLASSPEQLQGREVLIVDDNQTNLNILTTQTRQWGMIPRPTDLPAQALTWINEDQKFDLALLDMQMPDMDGLTLALEIRKKLDPQQLPMIMLTSLGRKEPNIEAAHFAAYLYKPIRLSQLHNVLMDVVARQKFVSSHKTEKETFKIDKSLAERIPLRILLAEDYQVNQRLALQILSKMGYRADLAANGLEVLEALERQKYDVILMDVHMPEMDGLEASRQIHQRWPPEARPYIIAVTAEAMTGDREKCLGAGMNDYISKPIRINELTEALSKCQPPSDPVPAENSGEPLASDPPSESSLSPESPLPHDTQPEAPLEAAPPPAIIETTQHIPPVDWATVEGLRSFQQEGEPDFVLEMFNLYQSEAPSLLESIRQAIIEVKPDRLNLFAHSLKGNSNSMGAQRVGILSFQLERIGKAGSVEGAMPLLDELEIAYQQFLSAFQSG